MILYVLFHTLDGLWLARLKYIQHGGYQEHMVLVKDVRNKSTPREKMVSSLLPIAGARTTFLHVVLDIGVGTSRLVVCCRCHHSRCFLVVDVEIVARVTFCMYFLWVCDDQSRSHLNNGQTYVSCRY
jgi:hypothetical protein